MLAMTGNESTPKVRWVQRARFVTVLLEVSSARDITHLMADDGRTFSCLLRDGLDQTPYGIQFTLFAPVERVDGPHVASHHVAFTFQKQQQQKNATRSNPKEWDRLTELFKQSLPFKLSYDWDLNEALPDDTDSSSSSSSRSGSDQDDDDDDGEETLEKLIKKQAQARLQEEMTGGGANSSSSSSLKWAEAEEEARREGRPLPCQQKSSSWWWTELAPVRLEGWQFAAMVAVVAVASSLVTLLLSIAVVKGF